MHLVPDGSVAKPPSGEEQAEEQINVIIFQILHKKAITPNIGITADICMISVSIEHFLSATLDQLHDIDLRKNH